MIRGPRWLQGGEEHRESVYAWVRSGSQIEGGEAVRPAWPSKLRLLRSGSAGAARSPQHPTGLPVPNREGFSKNPYDCNARDVGRRTEQPTCCLTAAHPLRHHTPAVCCCATPGVVVVPPAPWAAGAVWGGGGADIHCSDDKVGSFQPVQGAVPASQAAATWLLLVSVSEDRQCICRRPHLPHPQRVRHDVA